jgi:hypothetical protein
MPAGGSNYYVGTDPYSSLGDTPRFFYGLRKNENGSMFFERLDNIRDKDTVTLNNPGLETDNYNDFEVGVDFFEGTDVTHNPVFLNLKYPQYRWDDRSLFYYVDDDGQLVVRINNGHTYNNGDSEG